MTSKPHRKPPQSPPRFTATPESLIRDTNKLIDRSRYVLDNIVAKVKPDGASFENVLLPMAYDENNMANEAHILGFYQAVSTSSALRDASTEADKLLEDFSIEASMREDIFQLVDAVLKKEETLEPESGRLLEKEHKSYIRNGLGLPAGPMRDRFKEIKKRLSDISITFQKNLNEETGGIWFAPEDLDGVPDDVLSSLQKGEGENAGKLRLTFKYPDLFPTLKYAKNPATRKKVFIDNENKCNQNVPLFQEAVILRDEAARLLGYPNHAAFKIEDKMAKTPETVDEFLGDLRSRLTAGGRSEVTRLKEIKKEDLKSRGEESSDDGHYYLWDHRYYDRLMLENEYALDQQKIAEYFPLQTTIRGMLEIFERIFGLVFVEIPPGEDRDLLSESGKGNEIAWHEDVTIFSVWDDEGEGGGFVGYLYLDLFPREGKYGHAANFNLQPVCYDSVLRPVLLTPLTYIYPFLGVYRRKRHTALSSNCSCLQFLQAHTQKTQSAEARRGRDSFSRVGSWHS
jgi:metallopeptidase MepB